MFENLLVYQKAVDFADHASALTETFPRGYYFLADQLNRAALSVATNLAEGNGRFTKADRKNFFGIARGSAAYIPRRTAKSPRSGLFRHRIHTGVRAGVFLAHAGCTPASGERPVIPRLVAPEIRNSFLAMARIGLLSPAKEERGTWASLRDTWRNSSWRATLERPPSASQSSNPAYPVDWSRRACTNPWKRGVWN